MWLSWQFCSKTSITLLLWSVATTGHHLAAQTILTKPSPAPSSQAAEQQSEPVCRGSCLAKNSDKSRAPGHMSWPVRSASAAQTKPQSYGTLIEFWQKKVGLQPLQHLVKRHLVLPYLWRQAKPADLPPSPLRAKSVASHSCRQALC